MVTAIQGKLPVIRTIEDLHAEAEGALLRKHRRRAKQMIKFIARTSEMSPEERCGILKMWRNYRARYRPLIDSLYAGGQKEVMA